MQPGGGAEAPVTGVLQALFNGPAQMSSIVPKGVNSMVPKGANPKPAKSFANENPFQALAEEYDEKDKAVKQSEKPITVRPGGPGQARPHAQV